MRTVGLAMILRTMPAWLVTVSARTMPGRAERELPRPLARPAPEVAVETTRVRDGLAPERGANHHAPPRGRRRS